MSRVDTLLVNRSQAGPVAGHSYSAGTYCINEQMLYKRQKEDLGS